MGYGTRVWRQLTPQVGRYEDDMDSVMPPFLWLPKVGRGGVSNRAADATMTARCGIQDFLIKTLERWESVPYTRYVRTSPELLCRVSGTLMNDGGGCVKWP